MRTISLTAIAPALVALASLVVISGCGQLYADKVVSVGEHELTVTKGPDETLKTHVVADDAEVTLDGQEAALQDIRPGDLVKVTTENLGDQELVIRVEATRSADESAVDRTNGSDELNPPLPLIEPTDEENDEVHLIGVITFVAEDQIGAQGKEQTDEMIFTLTDETEITLAGEPVSKDELAAGMEVTITAERQGDRILAKRIDAERASA